MRFRMGKAIRDQHGNDVRQTGTGMDNAGNRHHSSIRTARMPRSILSKEFKYINSVNTNLSETFKRIREEMQVKIELQREQE